MTATDVRLQYSGPLVVVNRIEHAIFLKHRRQSTSKMRLCTRISINAHQKDAFMYLSLKLIEDMT